ncbi:MAG: molecular chaperone HtpG [Clostridia bacterium]|nr:molecular chaperone HtpG [Clostridia bacterium]
METKQFKAESKRLLDLMINSIYTNKEIFLRELISNASDAMDKLYYQSLTDKNIKVNKDDLVIKIATDQNAKTLTIEDKGIGMSQDELETNLGTIAQSGSFLFKNENEKKDDVDIIGQFGVGFYSAFMVSKEVEVISKKYGEEKAYKWTSKGAEGYTIEEASKDDFGTKIILHIKDDSEEEKFSDFLNEYRIKGIVKRYSDYIRFPIQMDVTKKDLKEGSKDEYVDKIETETLNSMIPIWKKKKSEVTDEELNSFYAMKFGDFEKPTKVIRASVEGMLNYDMLVYIPSVLPFDYYTKEFEKGLQLYSNGVLIMEKCKDLLPDYFSFVKGLVDSPDLSLNISREILQQDRQLKTIAKNIEKKIKSELEDMLNKDRDEYVKFFKTFGIQLKFGCYNNFGVDKDKLKDLLMFYSSTEKKLVTLKEYVTRMKEGQDKIYYACGETVDKIDMLPQVEGVKDKGYEILYLTDEIDEFVLQVLVNYEEKEFANVSANDLNLDSEEDKKKIEKLNEDNKDMLTLMQEAIPEVAKVCFTNRLKDHPVCLTSEGAISVEMQKVINAMPNNRSIQAKTSLEINENHAITEKLKSLYETDKDALKNYAKILYAQAKLIEGLSIDNPTEISNLICDLISK